MPQPQPRKLTSNFKENFNIAGRVHFLPEHERRGHRERERKLFSPVPKLALNEESEQEWREN